jgi:molybdopterin-guanine dinucleotide biosynthesis protein A
VASPTDLSVMLAVDMPFISWAFLDYLISQARSAPEAAVVVPRAGGSSQPLCAIYRREFAVAAETALRSGQNKIDRLFAMVPTRMIDEQELEAAGFSPALFRNMNTPQELRAEKGRV